MRKTRTNAGSHTIATVRPVEALIQVVRGQRVMVDSDLATVYGVPTKALNQAVRRNIGRFPEDFAFRLSKTEFKKWRSQIVTSNRSAKIRSAKMGLRRPPYVFTQVGVAMLSAALRSPRAAQMSIQIIRAFIRMRELMTKRKDIAIRMDKRERSHRRATSVIEVLVEDVDRLAREAKVMEAIPPAPGRKDCFPSGS